MTCLIVGHGAVLSIDIDGGRQVHFLKEEIVKKKQKSIFCDADELTLYLAKKNGDFQVMTMLLSITYPKMIVHRNSKILI